MSLLVRGTSAWVKRGRWSGPSGTPTTPVPVEGLAAIRTSVHGPNSIWNLPLASRSAAARTIDTELSDIDGQTHAFNLAQQSRYNNATATDGIFGYFGPGFGSAINMDNYSMPVYVVPAGQAMKTLHWKEWPSNNNGQQWTRVGPGVSGDLEGKFSAVPLPDLDKMNPGTNGMRFTRVAAQGATTIYVQEENWGTHGWGGGTFTVTSRARVGTTTEYALTISPGLAAAATVNGLTTRPRQMESNGTDKSLIILRQNLNGTIELWEMWGFRPDGNSPGGYSFANGGYVADTRTWNGVFPFTWGMRAVSLSAVGGAITLDDVKRGTINHALNLAITVSGTVNGKNFDAPATRWDGANMSLTPSGSNKHRVRLGGYFRLPEAGWSDAQIDTFVAANMPTVAYRDFSRMVLRALRDYGMYLTDTAGAVSFYGEGRQSAGTEYSPHTIADYNAMLDICYDFYRMPFWDSLVKLVPVTP